MTSSWEWLKQKWKLVLAAILGVLGLFTILSRSRSQKRVLEKANESHRRDNKINEEALSDLTSGLDEIVEEQSSKARAALREHEKIVEEIANEKKEFISASIESENLAESLADSIGADFVKKDQ